MYNYQLLSYTSLLFIEISFNYKAKAISFKLIKSNYLQCNQLTKTFHLHLKNKFYFSILIYFFYCVIRWLDIN